MMPYKDDIFRELEAVLATAEPEQISQLLRDIAQGSFAETAQTRAGTNDNRANVTDIVQPKKPQADCARPDLLRTRYSS